MTDSFVMLLARHFWLSVVIVTHFVTRPFRLLGHPHGARFCTTDGDYELVAASLSQAHFEVHS